MNQNDGTIRYFCAECHKVYSISRQDMFELNEYSFTFGGNKVKKFINKVTKSKFTKIDDNIIRVNFCPICHKYTLGFRRSWSCYDDYSLIVKRISEEDIDFEKHCIQPKDYTIDGKTYTNAIVRIKQKKEESPSVFDKDIEVSNEAGYNALLKATANTLKGITNDKKEDDDMADIVVNDDKTVSIFIKLNGVDIDLSKLRKIIYIDEFTDIKTEYDITKIELRCDAVTIYVDAGEKSRSIKIKYDRYNDTDYSMLELVSPDTLSFVRRV